MYVVIQDIINNFTLFGPINHEVPVLNTSAVADFRLDKASELQKFFFSNYLW